MINYPHKYGLIGSHESAVPVNLIKSYYSFGWRRTNGKWDARNKLYFPILHGVLEGQVSTASLSMMLYLHINCTT